MKRVVRILTGILAAGLLVLAVPSGVYAASNDSVIHDFFAKYEVFNDTNGGRMTVEETIDIQFLGQNRGILRSIPTKYKKQPLKLTILAVERDGNKEPYTTYGQNDNEVLKIGDADVFHTGKHTYVIRYEMRNIVSFFEGYDEWYWDINGTQWDQPFEQVGGEVVFPEGWDNQGLPTASCYTGKENSVESFCSIRQNQRGYAFSSRKRLGPGENLSVATPMQKGLFTPRDRTDWFRDNAWQIVGLAAGLGLAALAFAQWWRFGKDYKGRGTIVPQFDPPKGLSPAEVGLLMDYSVDGRDLTATIIDLAVRGYIKIHDDEKKTLGVFKSHDFSLELVNNNFSDLKEHEKKLIHALFKSTKTGTTQRIKDIDKTKMYKAVTEIRKHLGTVLKKEHGLIEETPGKAQFIVWGIVGGAFLAMVLLRPGWGWIAGMLVADLSALLFGILLRRRSHAGVEAYDHVKGLTWYMNTAEKDRFDKMQSVDRPYAEPARSAKLFEKLLPYAVALGVEKSWAKQFDNIYTQEPDWYTGNYASFNAAYLASGLTSGVSAMNTNFTQSTSSSSSGSGGGGFSGGGGGGGGGGTW